MIIFGHPLSFGFSPLGPVRSVVFSYSIYQKNFKWNEAHRDMKWSQVSSWVISAAEFLFLLLLRKWEALEAGTPQPKKSFASCKPAFFHFPIWGQHLTYDLVSTERQGSGWSSCERESVSSGCEAEQKEPITMSTWRFLLNRETRDWFRYVCDL